MSEINGYPYVYMPNHPKTIGDSGCVYVHVLVAEEKLGRYLRNGETVHHIDENRSNNSPDNLIVFAEPKYHTSYHKSGGRGDLIPLMDGTYIYNLPVTTRKCLVCGRETTNTYCSKRCVAESQKRTTWPTKEELTEMVLSKMSFLSMGRKFGVCDNTIRKWCRLYGIPYKRKDIRDAITQM